MAGRLAGIARHARARGPIEEVRGVAVTVEEGIHGDFRGARRPGKTPRRQISLIEADGWAAAMADLGLTGENLLAWSARRANLLIEGLRLPRAAGTIVRIGEGVRIQVTQECDPCSRMEEIHPGLKAALLPDWRGGFLGTVLEGGDIAIGDTIRIEE